MAQSPDELCAELYNASAPDWSGEIDFYRELAAEAAVRRGVPRVLPARAALPGAAAQGRPRAARTGAGTPFRVGQVSIPAPPQTAAVYLNRAEELLVAEGCFRTLCRSGIGRYSLLPHIHPKSCQGRRQSNLCNCPVPSPAACSAPGRSVGVSATSSCILSFGQCSIGWLQQNEAPLIVWGHNNTALERCQPCMLIGYEVTNCVPDSGLDHDRHKQDVSPSS
jgi:hypothetical protein